MSEHVQQFTDTNFTKEVLEAEQPVLVDFWAAWCMPCRFVAPVVESLATEYAGKVKVGKVDVDSNPAIAGNYGISSIPTLAIFKNGKVVDGVVGAAPKEHLQKLLDKHVSQDEN
ncbi:thioredoxin [candidate division KSB1 bacterium]|nr:thioredoxin [candidate division KSB1 bacterium]